MAFSLSEIHLFIPTQDFCTLFFTCLAELYRVASQPPPNEPDPGEDLICHGAPGTAHRAAAPAVDREVVLSYRLPRLLGLAVPRGAWRARRRGGRLHSCHISPRGRATGPGPGALGVPEVRRARVHHGTRRRAQNRRGLTTTPNRASSGKRKYLTVSPADPLPFSCTHQTEGGGRCDWCSGRRRARRCPFRPPPKRLWSSNGKLAPQPPITIWQMPSARHRRRSTRRTPAESSSHGRPGSTSTNSGRLPVRQHGAKSSGHSWKCPMGGVTRRPYATFRRVRSTTSVFGCRRPKAQAPEHGYRTSSGSARAKSRAPSSPSRST